MMQPRDNHQAELGDQTKRLTAICIAMSAEKKVERILRMIVDAAMDFTNADGATLYLVDEEGDALRFTIVRSLTLKISLDETNDSFSNSKVPLHLNGQPNMANVSAYAAIIKQTINIPDVYNVKDFDFSGTRAYDQRNQYRCQSMLVVPMKDHLGEVTGVLQLVNALCKDKGNSPQPFSADHQELVEALASQAAVAVNNARLIRDMKALFDSFIVTVGAAIDEKSAFTGGHIRRVQSLTMAIAKAVNKSNQGPFAEISFTENELEELQTAAWLHDFGKVATPEFILDKRFKLETIVDRSELIRLRYEIAILNTRLAEAPSAQAPAIADRIRELEDERDFVLSANSGKPVGDADISRLEAIFRDRSTMTPDELHNLSIRRGTLTEEERAIIEKHVEVTYRTLARLRFPKHLSNVPRYAGGHHEKLDGSGYWQHLKGTEIPLQTRILTIADIFEALTAKRPYKQSMPVAEALAILNAMAAEGKLDQHVINIAISSGVFDEYSRHELGDPAES